MPFVGNLHMSKGRQTTRNVTAGEVLTRLLTEYGPLRWEQRREPVAELVTTILSQHTSDVNSERAYDSLIDRFGSLEAVVGADVEEIAHAVRSGGLAQQKAPRIKEALKRIVEERGSLDLDFLQDMSLSEAKAWLTSLPGVGKKTAAVTLCFSFGMPAMAVDTHVYRVSKRLGLIGDKTNVDQAHDILEAAVPQEDVYAFHVCLITHGRQVCKAPRPLCQSCVLVDGCPTGRRLLGTA